MIWYEDTQRLRQEVLRCMKCGNCQAVCPIYQELRREAGVARGKIRLVEAYLGGELPATHGLERRLDLCLTCGACTASCPSGVRFDQIIISARAAMIRERGLPIGKKLLFYGGLRNRRVVKLGLKGAYIVQRAAFRRHPFRKAGYPRLPIGLDPRRIVPEVAARPLVEASPPMRVKKPVAQVAYFAGCLNNYIYTDIGHSVINVLAKNGVEVSVPREQHCCGIPCFAHGDLDLAREMARSSVDLFWNQRVDAIITSCATCGVAWKHHFHELLEGEPSYAEKARALAQRTFDVAEFLVDVVGYLPPQGYLQRKVTYHDPCHANRILNIRRQPRAILQSIPGVEFIEMSNPDRCCGGAGLLSLTHYQLSMRISARKVEDIKRTGGEVVATSCPACRLQLEDALNRFGTDTNVVYVTQLLDEAYNL